MAAILSRPQCVNDEMINQFKSAFNRWPINMENNETFFLIALFVAGGSLIPMQSSLMN